MAGTIMTATMPTAAPVRAQQPAARVSGLLHLEKSARHAATVTALGFVLVNETHSLLPYRQAALWWSAGRRVLALSGVVRPDEDAPYVRWLGRVFRHLDLEATAGMTGVGGAANTVRVITAGDLPADLAAGWEEWWPAEALWLPLAPPQGQAPAEVIGGLMLVREAPPWSDGDRTLATYLADAYGHAWAALPGQRRRDRWFRRLLSRRGLWGLLLLGLVAGMGAIPLPLSVLAPAEVIGADPVVVRAPFEGVIERMVVTPNEAVKEGQLLFTLDPVRLRNRLEVAHKALEIAEAELRQGQQQALWDQRSKAGLAALQGRRDQQVAEVNYLAGLLERIEVKAPRDGVAVFADVNEWIGRPVAIGERVLMIADPARVELEIQMPEAEAIALEPEAPVALFLNIAPHQPLAARLSFIGYKAAVQPDGVLAYRLKARLEETAAPPPRLGLKGTAKLYGAPARLYWQVLRRPLATARVWLAMVWP